MRPKVFGIGLHRTGTTTLDFALRALGYSVASCGKALRRNIRRGRLNIALDYVDRFDAAQNMPWPFLFANYGMKARYILTVRKTPAAWLQSVKAHYLQRHIGRVLFPAPSMYGRQYPFGFEREYLRFYETHNADIRAFFKKQGAESSLLELCMDRGDGWPELCGFLGKPVPAEPFPHANAMTARKWRRPRQIVNAASAYVRASLNGQNVRDLIFRVPPQFL